MGDGDNKPKIDYFTCCKCGKEVSYDDLTVHHSPGEDECVDCMTSSIDSLTARAESLLRTVKRITGKANKLIKVKEDTLRRTTT